MHSFEGRLLVRLVVPAVAVVTPVHPRLVHPPTASALVAAVVALVLTGQLLAQAGLVALVATQLPSAALLAVAQVGPHQGVQAA